LGLRTRTVSQAFHCEAVDAYCLQHPPYILSAKSFAAHLTGACAAFEHPNPLVVQRAVVRWLSSNPAITKPELPPNRGSVTIADVYQATDLIPAVETWKRSTWEAYHDYHSLARSWIQQAFSFQRR
jgi:hypothetical protein